LASAVFVNRVNVIQGKPKTKDQISEYNYTFVCILSITIYFIENSSLTPKFSNYAKNDLSITLSFPIDQNLISQHHIDAFLCRQMTKR